MNIEKLTKIAEARGNPCVSISLNTHRTHPENKLNAIALKNLCAQAEQRLVDEFGKRDIANILSALNKLPSEIDINHNLDSLHIFYPTICKRQSSLLGLAHKTAYKFQNSLLCAT